ncbi:MAG: hypothetical protein ACYDH6_19195 [Acidimicrobiales bacterium]
MQFTLRSPLSLSDAEALDGAGKVRKLFAGFTYSQGTRADTTFDFPDGVTKDKIDFWTLSIRKTMESALADPRQPDKPAVSAALRDVNNGRLPIFGLAVEDSWSRLQAVSKQLGANVFDANAAMSDSPQLPPTAADLRERATCQ